MYIKELSVAEFEKFASNHQHTNYHQTINYATLKSENDYEYELIGFCDNENIYAAALVLVKAINNRLYAYIPEGFLIDYNNDKLLYDFTQAIYKRYKKEHIVSVKINPSIPISTINPKTQQKTYNNNQRIINTLLNCGFKKIESEGNFNTILPNTNAIVNLDEYDENKLNKNTKNKIRKGIRKGLTLEISDNFKLNYLYDFTKKKINKKEFYYNDYYNVFKRNNAIDYFLVSINYQKFIENSEIAYVKESVKNELLSENVVNNPGTKNINKKLSSDKKLEAYKNDVAFAAQNLEKDEKTYIAGALVIKHANKVTFLISGYDKTYKEYVPNYFLYNEILKYYKDKYKFADLNGISQINSTDDKYHGLNRFKIGFNPTIYEYIGEFDLIINKIAYSQKKVTLKDFLSIFKTR